MKHCFSTNNVLRHFCTVYLLEIFGFGKDGDILEVSVTFWNILMLSGTFQNIVGLAIKGKNHLVYPSEIYIFYLYYIWFL